MCTAKAKMLRSPLTGAPWKRPGGRKSQKSKKLLKTKKKPHGGCRLLVRKRTRNSLQTHDRIIKRKNPRKGKKRKRKASRTHKLSAIEWQQENGRNRDKALKKATFALDEVKHLKGKKKTSRRRGVGPRTLISKHGTRERERRGKSESKTRLVY